MFQDSRFSPATISEAGLQADVEIPYQNKTEYSGDNETIANVLWEASNSTSAGAIALNHEWAALKGLIRAQSFPGDTGKGIYYVQGIHDVHCTVGFTVAQCAHGSFVNYFPTEAPSKIHLRISPRVNLRIQGLRTGSFRSSSAWGLA